MPAFLLCGNSEDAIVKGFKHERMKDMKKTKTG